MPSLGLHLRLALALLTLLVIAGSVNLASTLIMSRQYLNEVTQMANRGLARQIAEAKAQRLVTDAGKLSSTGLEEILHWMMVVHPGPHFYVLDLRGEIIAFDPAAGEPVKTQVALAPVRRYLDRERLYEHRVRLAADQSKPAAAALEREPIQTILGDDPRAPGKPTVFSVSPLPAEGEPMGYLYIVLRPQSVESLSESLRGSYILQLTVRNGAVYLLVTLVVGLVVFYRLTRPLRRLAERVDRMSPTSTDPPSAQHGTAAGSLLPSHPEAEPELEGRDLESSLSPDTPGPGFVGDEVSWLEQRFDAMGERLHRHLDEAEKLDRLRRDLFANVSHDLRTPIATLRGYLETLALGDEALTPEQRAEYLAIALRHSERLSRLVNELLELSKLDSHSAAPNLERFQIGELIQDNTQRFRLRAEKIGVTLRAEINPDAPAVLADLGLMERALENLISNALRHTDAGGSVTVAAHRRGGRLRISVADTGCGIAEQDLPYIFERFHGSRTISNGRLSTAGTGLGLAITQRIAELHHSELKVESTVGEGTTFSFELDISPQTRTSGLGRITRRTREWLDSLKTKDRIRPFSTS